jgi:hypothetical protein
MMGGINLELAAGAVGAAVVVVWGLWLAKRHQSAAVPPSEQTERRPNS